MAARKTTTALSKSELFNEIKDLRQQIKDLKNSQKLKEKRTEQESRKKFLSIFNNILDPVFIYDAATYRFMHCNEAAVEKYGYSRDEILTMTPFDLHKPEDFEKVRNSIDKRSGDTPITFTHLTRDRRQLIVEVMSEEIYFDGNPAWMRVIHDMTERIPWKKNCEVIGIV